MRRNLHQAAILELKEMADAESYGYSDLYYELVDAYHAEHDPSWMPNGYTVPRLPSIVMPIIVDMSAWTTALESDRGALMDFVSKLKRADRAS